MRIKINKGKSKKIEFELKDSSNNAIDLSGLPGTFNVILDVPKTNSSAVITKTVVITSATEGLCYVLIDDTDSDIIPAVYSYQLSFLYGVGDNRVLDSGTLEIIGDDTELINQIKQAYGLGFDYYTMKKAVDYAKEQLLLNCFLSEEGKGIYTDTNNAIKICNYIMDSNFDGSITSDDVEVYEYLPTYPYTVVALNSNISSLILNTPDGSSYIVMDDSYPSEGYKLVVKYKRGSKQYEDSLHTIDYVIELYTLYHLFKTLPVNKLQRGITNRSINGVDIQFDKSAIDEFIKTLFNWITNEKLKLLPFSACFGGASKSPIARSIQINKGY